MSRRRLEFRAVDQDNWNDLALLFEARGGPKSCWCMVWRQTPAEAKQTDGKSRRAALLSRVSNGVPIGILGYAEGTPVAWCSIAPRSTYRRLGARKQGAKVVEAYPVDPDSPSYRFMGFVGLFEKAGFAKVGIAGTRRHVMRLTLTR